MGEPVSIATENHAISFRALSSESEPWVAFSPTFAPNSLRIVPASAFAGSVAPISVRQAATASSFSRTATTTGPRVMNSTSSPKKGRCRWTA